MLVYKKEKLKKLGEVSLPFTLIFCSVLYYSVAQTVLLRDIY